MDIQELVKLPTSSKYLRELLDGKVKIISYPELIKYDTLEQLLEPFNRVIILYLQKEGFGHWTCIFKRGNTIEHFDPYGYFPDDELNFKIDPYFRKRNNLEYPMLSLLLYDAFDRYKMTFNEHRFQKLSRDISTCGRHCVVRLWNQHLKLNDYKKLMYSTEYTPDELVTIMTS